MIDSLPTGTTPLDLDMFGDGFFRGAIESSNDCVRVLDPKGRLLFMNKGGLVAFEIDDRRGFGVRDSAYRTLGHLTVI
jgi:hypothetical protein